MSGGKNSPPGVPLQLLAATALAFFAMMAMSAIEGRARTGLPDIVRAVLAPVLLHQQLPLLSACCLHSAATRESNVGQVSCVHAPCVGERLPH